MLSESRGTRLVYEPANLVDHAFDGVSAAQLALPHEGGPASVNVAAALHGSLRGEWVDQFNRTHVVKRRVVKDVRALALAGEVHTMVPNAPVVVLVRHPIGVARSVRELGWSDAQSPTDIFEREVVRWCEAHARAFGDPRLSDALFVEYEVLKQDPRAQLGRIVHFASSRDRTWRAIRVDQIDVGRASSTNFRGSATSASDQLDWHSVSSELVDFTVTTLQQYGLSALYGAAPLSKIDINEFVVIFRKAQS
jgi:hypothetical protein